MKKINIAYWIFTALLALMMAYSGLGGFINYEESHKVISGQLHYPDYFINMLGAAKILGAVVILIPGYPRLKEWVYAGFTFDILAACYSMHMVGIPVPYWIPVLIIGLVLIFGSYIFHHKRLAAGKKQ